MAHGTKTKPEITGHLEAFKFISGQLVWTRMPVKPSSSAAQKNAWYPATYYDSKALPHSAGNRKSIKHELVVFFHANVNKRDCAWVNCDDIYPYFANRDYPKRSERAIPAAIRKAIDTCELHIRENPTAEKMEKEYNKIPGKVDRPFPPVDEGNSGGNGGAGSASGGGGGKKKGLNGRNGGGGGNGGGSKRSAAQTVANPGPSSLSTPVGSPVVLRYPNLDVVESSDNNHQDAASAESSSTSAVEQSVDAADGNNGTESTSTGSSGSGAAEPAAKRSRTDGGTKPSAAAAANPLKETVVDKSTGGKSDGIVSCSNQKEEDIESAEISTANTAITKSAVDSDENITTDTAAADDNQPESSATTVQDLVADNEGGTKHHQEENLSPNLMPPLSKPPQSSATAATTTATTAPVEHESKIKAEVVGDEPSMDMKSVTSSGGCEVKSAKTIIAAGGGRGATIKKDKLAKRPVSGAADFIGVIGSGPDADFVFRRLRLSSKDSPRRFAPFDGVDGEAKRNGIIELIKTCSVLCFHHANQEDESSSAAALFNELCSHVEMLRENGGGVPIKLNLIVDMTYYTDSTELMNRKKRSQSCGVDILFATLMGLGESRQLLLCSGSTGGPEDATVRRINYQLAFVGKPCYYKDLTEYFRDVNVAKALFASCCATILDSNDRQASASVASVVKASGISQLAHNVAQGRSLDELKTWGDLMTEVSVVDDYLTKQGIPSQVFAAAAKCLAEHGRQMLSDGGVVKSNGPHTSISNILTKS